MSKPPAKRTHARGLACRMRLAHFQCGGFETAALRPPQDEVLDPHGEERGNAARLEPRGHRTGMCSSAKASAMAQQVRVERGVNIWDRQARRVPEGLPP